MKKKLLIGVGAVLLVVVCVGVAFLAGAGSTYYYTQIDNSKVERIAPHGAMNYSYTLPSYNEDGKERSITLETARELKEAAFIRLEVAPVRGVLTWAEVQYEELPTAVQSNYQK